jgi:hypothetical protein
VLQGSTVYYLEVQYSFRYVTVTLMNIRSVTVTLMNIHYVTVTLMITILTV